MIGFRGSAAHVLRRNTNALKRQRNAFFSPTLKGGPPQPPHRSMARGSSGQGWYKQYEESGPESFVQYNPPTAFDWTRSGKTCGAYFDVSFGEEPQGRIEMQLLEQLLPVTVGNFKALCTGENPRDFRYTGTIMHQIVKGAAVVGGDVEMKGGQASHSAGLHGEAAYGGEGRYFADEGLLLPHTEEGILSMVNGGVDTNGSQFYITTAPAPHLDGYSVAFGRVVNGMDVVHKISKVFSIRGRPVESIVISAAGLC